MTAIDLFNCAITSVRTRADKSISFGVVTAEMKPQQMLALFAYAGASARVFIAEHGSTEAPIETVATKRNGHTPSQALRAVIYRISEQRGISDHEAYYRQRMSQIISTTKLELE